MRSVLLSTLGVAVTAFVTALFVRLILRYIADLKLAPDELIAMIMRGEESLIPDGKTRILEGDRVVTYRE